MKRIVCCCMLALVLLVTPVYAAEIDLSSLSDVELQDLQVKVCEELTNRSLSMSATLTNGNYIAGRDIKPGRYVFSCLPDADSGSIIALYANIDDCRNNENALESAYLTPDAAVNTFSVTIEDEQALYAGVDIIATYTPALPFAP